MGTIQEAKRISERTLQPAVLLVSTPRRNRIGVGPQAASMLSSLALRGDELSRLVVLRVSPGKAPSFTISELTKRSPKKMRPTSR